MCLVLFKSLCELLQFSFGFPMYLCCCTGAQPEASLTVPAGYQYSPPYLLANSMSTQQMARLHVFVVILQKEQTLLKLL
jgi:hypothetical protein